MYVANYHSPTKVNDQIKNQVVTQYQFNVSNKLVQLTITKLIFAYVINTVNYK